MALRIIRKSSSQSHVEVIRGTHPERKPLLTLLCPTQDLTSVKALAQLCSENSWIQENAELIMLKSPALTEPLREHLDPLQHHLKLMSSTEKNSLSRNIRSMIQEASADYCLYLPCKPDAALDWLPQALAFLRENPNHAAAAPVLTQGENVLSAGQSLALDIPAHALRIGTTDIPMPAMRHRVWNIGKSIPVALWPQAPSPRPVPALPLAFMLFSRSAWLGLAWEDSAWDEDWIAQDVCLGLRQQQYWLHLLPYQVRIPETTAPEILSPGSVMPDLFMQRWRPIFRETLWTAYTETGFKDNDENLWAYHSEIQSADPVSAYFSSLKVS
jgi:hypothetical protein